MIATLFLSVADSGGGLTGELGINTWAFLSQFFSFLIVFLILWKWGFPAILKTLDKRQAVIREGIENAERAKRDLADATSRAEQLLIDARRQAQETIERAEKDAQRIANQIEEEARARAEQLFEQQKALIQQEANRARAEVSRLVVDISIDAAGRVIGRSVNTKDNRRLVEEFVASSDQTRNN